MDVKRHLTGLSDAGLLDDERRARLKELGVTTVEELVGVLDSEPERLRELLELDDEQVEGLKRDAGEALPASSREALQKMPPGEYRYGAVKPERGD
jgi:hypothetical protein